MKVRYFTPNKSQIVGHIISDISVYPDTLSHLYVTSYVYDGDVYYPYTDLQNRLQCIGKIQLYKNIDGVIGFDLIDPKFDSFGRFNRETLEFDRPSNRDFERTFMPLYQYDYFDLWSFRLFYETGSAITVDSLLNVLISTGIKAISFYDIHQKSNFHIANDTFKFQWNCRDSVPLMLQHDEDQSIQDEMEINVLVNHINQGSIQMIMPKYVDECARDYSQQFFTKYKV